MKSQDNILLVKHLLHESDASESKEVEMWVNETDENREYYREIELAWKLGGSVEKYYNSVNLQEELQHFQLRMELSEKTRKSFQISLFLKIASVFLLLLNLGLVISLIRTNKLNNTETFTELIVPNGSKSMVVLPDGSKVWLNAGSKLIYEGKFNRTIREVRLEGEAYFAVANDKKRPFVVKTARLSIRALGTEFNIRSYHDEGTIETTLIKGSVKVIEKREDSYVTEDVVLKPNQKLTFIKKTGKLFRSDDPATPAISSSQEPKSNDDNLETERKEQIIIDSIDPLPVISWREDKLILTGEGFEEVKVKLERWYDVKIIITDPELLNLRFKGTFKKEPLEQAMEALKLASPFHYQIDRNIITITR